MNRGELETLYRDYAPVIFRRCLAILGDRDEASDATHDIFLKLRDAMATFEKRAKLSSWIYRVATNHCLNVLRRRKTVERAHLVLASGSAQPPSMASAIARRALVQQLLARFDDRRVQIVVHVYYDGMAHREVAELLGISERAVRKSLKTALDSMRDQVEALRLGRAEVMA